MTGGISAADRFAGMSAEMAPVAVVAVVAAVVVAVLAWLMSKSGNLSST